MTPIFAIAIGITITIVGSLLYVLTDNLRRESKQEASHGRF